MPPPELTRDAPIANVFEPLQQDRALIIGHDFNETVEHRLLRRLGQRFHSYEPLRGDTRLDLGFAAVADTDRMGDVLDALKQAQFLEIAYDALARFEAVEPDVFAGGLAHVTVVGHYVRFGKVVALADCEVIGIVRWGNFDDAGAELAIDIRIRYDRDFPTH